MHKQVVLRNSISGTDIEQQLRLLGSSLEQYREHMQQAYKKYQPISYQQLKNKMLQHETYLEQYYQQCSAERQQLAYIFNQHFQSINQAVREFSELRLKISSLEEQIEDKDICLEDYKEKLDAREKQITDISIQLQNSRQHNATLYHQIDAKQEQFETDRRETRKTILEVKQETQLDKKMVEQLYDTQQQLRTTIQQLNGEKQFQLKRYKQLEENYLKIQNRHEELEAKLKQKEEQLQRIYIQQEERRKSSKDYQKYSCEESQEKQQNYYRNSFLEQVSASQKNKLSQDFQTYRLPIVKQLISPFIDPKKSFDELSEVSDLQSVNGNVKNVVTAISHPMKNTKNVIDPYYSHYILTSQSIKIKEDCQDMLNIDMKPYYKEVIEKRIPMHLWDEWIKNRLRELAKRKLHA